MPVSLPFQPRAVAAGARGKKKRGAAGSGASESGVGFESAGDTKRGRPREPRNLPMRRDQRHKASSPSAAAFSRWPSH